MLKIIKSSTRIQAAGSLAFGAPGFRWVHEVGVSYAQGGNEWAVGVAVDGVGNFYLSSPFTGTASFGSMNTTSVGDLDVLVAKYNSRGDVVWVRQAGGIGVDCLVVATDAGGNCYLVGKFSDTASFGSTNLISAGDADGFLAKFSGTGQCLWARRFGGTGYDDCQGLALDGAGNCYVTGAFENSAQFGSTNLVSAGGRDVFAAKFDNSGAQHWVTQAGGPNGDLGTAIAVNSEGRCYVTGVYSGSGTFGQTTLQNGGGWGFFLARYETNGNLLWVRQAYGSQNEFGDGVGVDSAGNCLVGGGFSGTATFGGITLTSAGQWDVFQAKFTPAGTLAWIQQAGGTGGDWIEHVATGPGSQHVVAGWFRDPANFGTNNLSGLGGNNIFLASVADWPEPVLRLASHGVFIWLTACSTCKALAAPQLP